MAEQLYPVMVKAIRTINSHGLNKRFCVGSQVQQVTPKEGQISQNIVTLTETIV